MIGDAEIKHPPGRWIWPAYQSNFTVDVDLLEVGVLAAVADAVDR